MNKNNKSLPSSDLIKKVDALRNEILYGIDPELEQEELQKAIEKYDDLSEEYEFHDLPFEENGRIGLKDTEGNIRVPARYYGFDEIYSCFENRRSPIPAINENGKVGLVATDGTGTPLSEFAYDHIHICQEYNDYFIAEKNGKFGILYESGKEVVPCEYDNIEEHYELIMVLQQKDKYGCFTVTAPNLFVPCEYDEFLEYRRRLHAHKGNQWGFIDEDGNFTPVEHPEEEDLQHFLSYDESTILPFFDDTYGE